MKKLNVYELLATWFYLGKFPKGPGTVGTVGAIPLVFVMMLLPSVIYMALAFVLTLLAIFICSRYEASLGVHDSKEIVIDEVVGYVIAMTWLPLTWQAFLGAFVLFRLLDILKPFPISQLDKKVEGGFGVVIDDVVAGLITNVVLQIVFTKTDLLGYQLNV